MVGGKKKKKIKIYFPMQVKYLEMKGKDIKIQVFLVQFCTDGTVIGGMGIVYILKYLKCYFIIYFGFSTASCNYESHLIDANTESNFTPGVVPLRHGSKVTAQVLQHWYRYSSRNLLNASIRDCLLPRL